MEESCIKSNEDIHKKAEGAFYENSAIIAHQRRCEDLVNKVEKMIKHKIIKIKTIKQNNAIFNKAVKS